MLKVEDLNQPSQKEYCESTYNVFAAIFCVLPMECHFGTINFHIYLVS